MSGTLRGLNSDESGAITPIGTDQYPFYGEFNGNGKTISNLWISSDYNDWKEKPPGAELINIGKSIGFFGNIGNERPMVNPRIGVAKNFIWKMLRLLLKLTQVLWELWVVMSMGDLAKLV